jgi:hypothetical protein
MTADRSAPVTAAELTRALARAGLPRDPAASLADLPALVATVGLPVDLRVAGEPVCCRRGWKWPRTG